LKTISGFSVLLPFGVLGRNKKEVCPVAKDYLRLPESILWHFSAILPLMGPKWHQNYFWFRFWPYISTFCTGFSIRKCIFSLLSASIRALPSV